MSVPGAANPLLLSSAAAGGGYTIDRSLRFNPSDSASLTRTFNATGSQTTYALSFWLKKTNSSTYYQNIIIDNDSSSSQIRINDTAGGFELRFAAAGASAALTTNRKFRDTSAWYHIVCVYDSTNATTSDRMRIYVNGVRETSFATETQPTPSLASAFITNGHTYTIGYFNGNTALDGYLAEVHYIDGLTPGTATDDPAGSVTGIPDAQYLTDFGEFDTNGVWQPIAYAGSYGTNGFHLDFADNSSAAALGYDAAGSNDWTVNNLSVTAGAGNDSLVDVPTNGTETDTGVGGEVRGNYATLNPLDNGGVTLSNGNLDVTLGATRGVRSGFGVSSGKYYYEMTVGTFGSQGPAVGIAYANANISTNYAGSDANAWVYNGGDGKIYNNNSGTGSNALYTTNDVIGVAINMDSGVVTFYKNGSAQPTTVTSLSGTVFPVVTTGGTAGIQYFNFGQRPFAYTAPSGYKALCSANLDDPTIEDPSTVMDVALWTGNGTSQTISGLGFSPDLVWLKRRDAVQNNRLYDTIRGAGAQIYSDVPDQEDTNVQTLSSFTATGFSVGSNPGVNAASSTYVGWTWDAGTSNATNNSGSITSTVRANISAGFSIVTYTGNRTSAQTIGHGLGVEPHFIIVKERTNSVQNWNVYHKSIGNTKALFLNLTNAETTTSAWNNTTPGSSVFTVGVQDGTNGTGQDIVAYCFAPVAGYSAFGSYTGNGSNDGPFVYTGFRPKFLLFKPATIIEQWNIRDAERDTSNPAGARLYPNLANAESTANNIDLLSNGFKVRGNSNQENASGETYIYAAFAESPFAYSRAR